MNDQKNDRKRKLALLGGLGLGLAMLGRKRRWRRYAMGQMMGGGYGGPFGRLRGPRHGRPPRPPATYYRSPPRRAPPRASSLRRRRAQPPTGPRHAITRGQPCDH